MLKWTDECKAWCIFITSFLFLLYVGIILCFVCHWVGYFLGLGILKNFSYKLKIIASFHTISAYKRFVGTLYFWIVGKPVLQN